MSKTEVSGKQLKDGSVELVDLAPEVSGVLNTLQSDVATLQTDVAAKADAGNLASVATSGSYNDLSDKPSIPSVAGLASETYVDTAVAAADTALDSLDSRMTNAEGDIVSLGIRMVAAEVDVATLQTDVAAKADSASLALVATSGSYTDLTNKPSLFSGDYGDLANKPTIPSVVGLASETYVDTAVAGVVNSAPAVLNTLNELSAALGNDENFATTVAGQIGDVASDVSALDVRVTAVEADVASIQEAATPNLSDLGEVAITTPSSGQVLKYDGLGWVNAADSTFSGAYADLTGKPSLFDGAYSSLTGAPSIPANLDDLSDVSVTSPANGEVLSYNGTAWVNSAAASGGASDLDGLSDVAITSAAKGHFLAHNGTSFVNTRTIEADVAATVPLTVKGAASQSGNLFNITDSANSNLVAVTSSGAAYFNGGGWNSAPVVVTGEIGNNPAFNIRGVVAGGSGNYGLLRIMGSGTGIIDFETSNSAGGSWNGRILGGAGLITIGTSSGASRGYPAWFGGWNATYPSLSLVALNAAAKGLLIKGAASQTASLFEVQNSSSQILNKIGSDGSVSMYDTAGANGFTLSNNSGEAKLSVAGGKKFNVASAGEYGYASSFSVADEGGTNAFSKGKWTIRTTQTAGLNIVPSFGNSNFFGGVGILVPNNRYIGARFHIFNITDAANRGDTDPMDNYSGQSKTSLLIHGYSNHTANHIEIQDQSNNVMFAINGQGQVQAATATSKALVVKGAASQTANLFEAQTSAGTALCYVNVDNGLTANGTTSTFYVAGGTNNRPTAIFRKSASPNFGFIEFQDSAGTVGAGINASFTIFSGGTQLGNSSGVFLYANGGIGSAGLRSNSGGTAWSVGGSITPADDAALYVATSGSFQAQRGLVVQQRNAGPNANILELKNSAGTNIMSVYANGNLSAGTGAFVSTAVGSKALVVKGAASQTANLFETQNSSGTALTYIDPNGYLNSYLGYVNSVYVGIRNNSRAVYIGDRAGESNAATSQDNVAVGFEAARYNTTGYENVVVGKSAMGVASSTAYRNTAVGYYAGAYMTSAFANTLIGHLAGTAITTATWNTLVGKDAGAALTTSGGNTFIGGQAGLAANNTTNAVFIGSSCGAVGTDMARSVGVGVSAHKNGYDNVAIGFECGKNMTNQENQNVYIGTSAAQQGFHQNKNVIIGYNAQQANITYGGSQIAIGWGAACTGSTALAIGVSASAAASCMDIRFGGASRITGDSSGNVAIANTLHAKRYTETVANAFDTALAPASGTLTVDTSTGNAVLGALSAAVTTWAFTNVPTDNSKVTTVTAVIAGNASYTYGDACSVNGTSVSGGIMWSGGSAPTATAGTDIITFIIVKDSAGTVKVFGSATTNFS